MSVPQEPGKVVTFYSYRGGTGRTALIANISWTLANKGKRVLVVDWDLDAPGLGQYFNALAGDRLQGSPGVMGLISAFAEVPGERATTARRTWVARFAETVRAATVSLDVPQREVGALDYIPAGVEDAAAHAQAVNNFNWSAFNQQQRGGTLLSALREELANNYDYVLIDCRTGYSGDRTGMVLMPDLVVVCFGLTQTSMETAATAIKLMAEHRTEGVRFRAIPMRIEADQQDRTSPIWRMVRNTFDPLLRMEPDELDAYWASAGVQNSAASDEVLAMLDRGRQNSPLLNDYTRIAAIISDDPTDAGQTIRPTGTISGPDDVMVSFAAADRAWADWVAARLSEVGIRARQLQLDVFHATEATAVLTAATANRTVIVLSERFEQQPIAGQIWRLATSSERQANAGPTVVLNLDATERPPAQGITSVDVESFGEAEVVDVLRKAFKAGTATGSSPGHLTVRYPQIPPGILELPARNERFTGRSVMLDSLRERMQVNPVQALCGLGGIGKSELALEYGHRFAADYDIVWWINAESARLVRASLFDLGQRLDIPNDSAHDVRPILDTLESDEGYGSWLLIYDGVESQHQLDGLIPSRGGHVVITSRDSIWDTSASVLPVLPFKRMETMAFIRQLIVESNDDDAHALAERLGDIPIAIGIACAYVAETGVTVGDYLQMLEAHTLDDSTAHADAAGPARAMATWMVSITHLDAHTPAAIRALETMAFLGPDPVPMAVLEYTAISAGSDDLEDEEFALAVLVNEIGRFGLARVDSHARTIQLNGLVQEIIRARIGREDADRLRTLAFQALAATARSKDPDEPDDWPLYRLLWPHVTSDGLLEATAKEVRNFVLQIIRYRYKRGDYAGSHDLAWQAVERWTQVSSVDDRHRLEAQYHRANALRRIGDFKEARAIDEDTLARQRSKPNGDNNPHTQMVASGLAADLRALGEYKEALRLDDEAWRRFKKTYGPKHRRALMFASNLADSHRMVGNFREAAKLNHQTYEYRREVLSEGHPYIAFSASSYGRDLRDLGDLEDSRHWLELALDSYLARLPVDHPDVLRTSKSLAVTLRRMGHFDAAHIRSVNTLKEYNRKLGSRHPESLLCRLTTATTLAGTERNSNARTMALSVVADMEDVLGIEHPYTRIAKNNLAVIELKLWMAEAKENPANKREQRDQVEAGLNNLRQEHEALRRAFGNDHGMVLLAALNVANHQAVLGDYSDPQEAEVHYSDARWSDQETWNRLTRVFGEQHPDALAAAINLAVGQRAGGETAVAKATMNRALEITVPKLGDKHPRVVAARNWKRWVNTYIDPPPM